VKAGPKAAVTAGPLDLRRLPASGGDRVVAFVEQFLMAPKGTGAKEPLLLRPWQRQIAHGLFDDPRPRQGLLALPRGNGKSTLAAALGLYGLFADGVEGAQVLCIASDERQARIVWNTARRMVELSPELAEQVQVFQDRIYVPATDSALFPLPAEPGALQGFDPSLAVIDELHVVPESVFDAIALAAGKRERSLTLAISTPAGDTDSVMFRLVEHGRYSGDRSFYFREWTAPLGCGLDDENAWAVANPALDDFLHRDAMRALLGTTREAAFRRYRLGQWVEDDDAWITAAAWAACAAPGRRIEAGAEVVLGFDGSYNGDATAIVAVSVGEKPHVEVVQVWERPAAARPEWQVPILEVEDAIRAAARKWNVVEIAADVFRWARTLQVLEAERLPVVEFPQNATRMTPATQRFADAVANGQLTHDGSADLSRHVANARLKVDSRGARIVKEHKASRRRIDLVVAAVMAHDVAAARPARNRGAWFISF